jgi:hypothetical protein
VIPNELTLNRYVRAVPVVDRNYRDGSDLMTSEGPSRSAGSLGDPRTYVAGPQILRVVNLDWKKASRFVTKIKSSNSATSSPLRLSTTQ